MCAFDGVRLQAQQVFGLHHCQHPVQGEAKVYKNMYIYVDVLVVEMLDGTSYWTLIPPHAFQAWLAAASPFELEADLGFPVRLDQLASKLRPQNTSVRE